MNIRLLATLLGRMALLIAASMFFSLFWAAPALSGTPKFEQAGFLALAFSMAISALVGWLLILWGKKDDGQLFRKEAMAVVGLSWVLAMILGALPFLLSGTSRTVANAEGKQVAKPLHIADALFESASGFSTTGATVINDLEDPELVPRCILFWRSSTHFLGGLGIVVLFVAILGQGSAGKALMRAEMPGPSKEGSQARMQHTAWVFAAIYVVLTLLLTILLRLEGMTLFDALCHAFGTMATGGFSTYNKSLGHFDSVAIETTVLVFMILAGTNFTLLYALVLRKPMELLADVEWRTYAGVIVVVTALIIVFGMAHNDFQLKNGEPWHVELFSALRYGLFQVVSILTTTGFGTHDFDRWNSFSRGVLFLLMFVGGCAGSTGGGLKIIRHILFLKVLWLEIEQAFHPSVVRPLRLGGEPVEDQTLRKNILVYFGLVLVIFVFSWMILVTIEPDATWVEDQQQNKLIDSASGIAATLNNIGPGLGTVGAAENYTRFSPAAKLLFALLMLVGRLEIFVILVLFIPAFWRNR